MNCFARLRRLARTSWYRTVWTDWLEMETYVADEMEETSSQGAAPLESETTKVDQKRQSGYQISQSFGCFRRWASKNDTDALTLTVIHAHGTRNPKNREKIEWKLITDLPVKTRKEAIEKLNWYAMRWKIEVFHKILKSGCKAEESKLRSSERLVNLISIFCIIGWRIFWLTMLHRCRTGLRTKRSPGQRRKSTCSMNW